ncbi:MAG: hypothetical protein KAI24_18460, partial [Planctomycetes bacterium]|nr:hypothetical protein [Planctomycetota bacterium]
MRAWLAVVLLVLLGGAGYWWLQGTGEAPPPADAPTTAADRQHEPADPERADLREVATPPPRQPPAEVPAVAPGDDAGPDAAPEPQDEPAPVVLTVVDVATGEPLPVFRWSFATQAGTARDEATANPARLALPRGAVGDLLVEAQGRQPHRRERLAVPGPGAPALPLRVELLPVPDQTGIT